MKIDATASSLKDIQLQRWEDMECPEPLASAEISTDSFEDSLLHGMSFSYWMDEFDETFNNGAIDLHDGTTVDDGPDNEARDVEYHQDGAKVMLEILDTYRKLRLEILNQLNLNPSPVEDSSILERIRRIIGNKQDSSNFDISFDVRSYEEMMLHTFIRRKRLDNAVVATLICTPEEEMRIRTSLADPSSRNQDLIANGLLGIQDDICSTSNEPFLKLYLPGCCYFYWTDADRENDDWIRVVYGIEVQIHGPEVSYWKESNRIGVAKRKLEVCTRDFLRQPAYLWGNLELVVALCRLMSKTGNEGEFLNIDQIKKSIQRRQELLAEEGIDDKLGSIQMRNEKVDEWVARLKEIIRTNAPDYDGLVVMELQQ